MKNYTITVNGTVYDVTVEENVSGRAPAPAAPKPAPKPAPAPAKAAPAPEKPAPAPAGTAGSKEVTAQVPGKVFKVPVSVGQAVKRGEAVIVLEAMKMEVDVVAQEDGTIATINVSVGDAVESGDVLATMN